MDADGGNQTQLTNDPERDGSPDWLSIEATPTPVPTPEPTPTPPPAGIVMLWGDDDCNSAVNAVDALKNLQEVAGFAYSQTDPCFQLGETVGVQKAGFGDFPWGDVDCDGDVDSVDALTILRWIAALPVNQEPGCPEIGSSVFVSA